MPKLEYFLVAESISVDQTRNQVSVFNILEEISIPRQGSELVVIPQLVAVSSWILQHEDEGKDFQVGVESLRPTVGVKQYRNNSTLNFTAKGTRQRIYFRFEAFPIERDGEVEFKLTLNGELKATHVLTVRWSDGEETQ